MLEILTHLEIRRNKIFGISKSNEGRMKVLAALASGLRKFAKIKIALEGAFKGDLAPPRQKDPTSREAISLKGRRPTLSQHCPTNGTQLS